MQSAGFADATLLVLAHGSTVNVGSAARARLHAAELRRRGWFAAVRECFWQQPPKLEEVLSAVTTPRVFLVPLFIGAGYFVDEVFPTVLGLKSAGEATYSRVRRSAGRTLFYCEPVGTHPGMTDVLLARARDVVAKHPFPRAPGSAETALFIVGHGTERSASSRRAVEAHVDTIRRRGEYAEVHPAFLEEAPFVADCQRVAQARNLVVVPFFVSDGLHVVEDIPVMLGESAAAVRTRLKAGLPTWRNPTERAGKRIWYAPGLGAEPLLAEVILQRVCEAAAWVAAHGGLTGSA